MPAAGMLRVVVSSMQCDALRPHPDGTASAASSACAARSSRPRPPRHRPSPRPPPRPRSTARCRRRWRPLGPAPPRRWPLRGQCGTTRRWCGGGGPGRSLVVNQGLAGVGLLATFRRHNVVVVAQVQKSRPGAGAINLAAYSTPGGDLALIACVDHDGRNSTLPRPPRFSGQGTSNGSVYSESADSQRSRTNVPPGGNKEYKKAT
ncbi:hypothetical protein C8F04DRAFT_163423 [Mycena alexandri]|uniref:Uncharacterized protein n=1 Tax=Mycena alexandri TaxID=1745969 RepID=A0AAD6SAI3_9AGAR|nr:hypothetical protein C8F04DRAFT_163423 [Mycena alexandri]